MNIRRVGLALAAALMVIVGGAAYIYRGRALNAGHQAYENHDYGDAFGNLSPFSGWWDARAQSELGVLYANGWGVAEDDRKAFELASRSAETGFPHAEYLVGVLYAKGLGVEQDNAKAVAWLRKAAVQGDAAAQDELGMHLVLGEGVPIDNVEAFDWLSKSAAQGNLEAEENLGSLYLSGSGVEQDYTKAALWLEKAVNRGADFAQNFMGDLYRGGLGKPKDDMQAARWYKAAADQGNLSAELSLGNLYFVGAGVPQDKAKAASFYQRSADKGNAAAQYNIGACFLNGDGVAKDGSKAFAMFQQSAMQGNPDAQNAIGELYQVDFYGPAGSPNDVLAYTYFDLAAAQGNKNAEQRKVLLENRLTPEQIKSAQALSSGWREGASLPAKTSFEDEAPQVIFDRRAPVAVFKASRIWFSRSFKSNGIGRYAVFVVTRGEEYHAASASVSVATFKTDMTPENQLTDGSGQRDFTQAGSFGDVPSPDDPNTPYTSSERLAVTTFQLTSGGVIFLVPGSYSGQGETMEYDHVFAFGGDGQPGAGAWVDLGAIDVGGDDSGSTCGDIPTSPEHACYAWKGTIRLVDVDGKQAPYFIVTKTGTIRGSADDLVTPADSVYRLSGGKYVEVSPSRTAQ